MDVRRDRAPVVVVAAGPAAATLPPDALPPGAPVIAADGGLARARTLGLTVDRVVGDMDSVDHADLDAAVASGAAVARHPEDKDATDLDLALDVALEHAPARLVVVGSASGRLDHVLATAALLAAPRFAEVAVEAWLGAAHLVVVRHAVALTGRAGDLVTLLPIHGTALGVTTAGLLYPLRNEDLPAGSTRGVSNELVGAEATVAVRGGVVVAVQPGAAGTHWRRGLR